MPLCFGSDWNVICNQVQEFALRRNDGYWTVEFTAMASPCEILIRTNDKSEVEKLASLAYYETRRIERKYSRYRDDNIVHAINNSAGQPVALDEETYRLLHYAEQCYELSEGLFDVTSGILRRAWRFDGGDFSPNTEQIASLLELVGWTEVRLKTDSIALLPGMEVDFGGIGKEYAVDRIADLLFRAGGHSLMVNFGGDVRCIGANDSAEPWVIGIESPDHEGTIVGSLNLATGAVATSGDAKRFCLVDGKRLGHILNPRTGWPVAGAPRSVTVVSDLCSEAGFLATLAMLSGSEAESFLKSQEVVYHCIFD